MSRKVLLLFTSFFISLSYTHSVATSAPRWKSIGGMVQGTNDIVYDMVLDASGNLYAGGRFTVAGDVVVNNIAKWDGNSWSALGKGMSLHNHNWSYVYSMAFDTLGTLFVSGGFDTVDGTVAAQEIAKWDGQQWTAVGNPQWYCSIQRIVFDHSGNLLAAGYFRNKSDPDTMSFNIARWDGVSWSTFAVVRRATADYDGFITSIVVDDAGNLFVGGKFDSINGVAAMNVAKWDGNVWSSIGDIDGDDEYYCVVNELSVDKKGNLYARGEFNVAGGVAVSGLAQWDGVVWSGIDTLMGISANSMFIDRGGILNVAGYFRNTDKKQEAKIGKWDGNSWSLMSLGGLFKSGQINKGVFDSLGNLFVGGAFSAGSKSGHNIARWDGTLWHGMGKRGGDGYVEALVCGAGGDVYAGGFFDNIGETDIKGIARWDGSTWRQLGEGLHRGVISALSLDRSGNLYAGGSFDSIGIVNANSIAKWDGSSWSALGDGLNGDVKTIVCDLKGNLYAGGYFMASGEKKVLRVAQWNGSVWSPLGDGLGDAVTALAVDAKGNLFAAGKFNLSKFPGDTHLQMITESYLVPNACNVAKWDGIRWQVLGSGVGNLSDDELDVHALAVAQDGTLFAAGEFYFEMDGKTISNIAQWDGERWQPVGGGLSRPRGIGALAFDNAGNLFAGPKFYKDYDDTKCNHMVVRWDGTTWTDLGNWTDDDVRALATDRNGNLYAGGDFSIIGDVVAPRVAVCRFSDVSVKQPGFIKAMSSSRSPGLQNGILRFQLQQAGKADCTVFSLTGREVYRISGYFPAGDNTLRIKENLISNATYIIRFRAEGTSLCWRMAVAQIDKKQNCYVMKAR